MQPIFLFFLMPYFLFFLLFLFIDVLNIDGLNLVFTVAIIIMLIMQIAFSIFYKINKYEEDKEVLLKEIREFLKNDNSWTFIPSLWWDFSFF